MGKVASEATISRTVATLAKNADRVLEVIHQARAAARARVWTAAGHNAPDHGTREGNPLVIDVDTTLARRFHGRGVPVT